MSLRIDRRYGWLSLLGAVMLLSLFLMGQGAPVAAETSLCANCHADKARLAKLSEQPDKVLVDPTEYAKDVHGRFACTTCHGGNKNEDSPKACVGVAYKDPAAPDHVKETCGSCHPDIAARQLTSLHTTLEGIHLSLIDLKGKEAGTVKFQETCNKCHATCSGCHMEEPDRRGIMWPRTQTHRFARRPTSQVCRACHGTTGDTYMGRAGKKENGPSVMYQAGLECSDCHTTREIHGPGTQPSFIVNSAKPKCEGCHAETRLVHAGEGAVAPQFDPKDATHSTHTDLTCQACHTQWYPNCWNCHEGRPQVERYDQFFLARHPVDGKITTATHSPMGPDWGNLDPIGGGWAIKTIHSWGKSQTCERCHTQPQVYIDEAGRSGTFVAAWSKGRMNASFIEPQLAQQMVIDAARFKRDVHQDTQCGDCHQSLKDDVCADCHTKAAKTNKTVLSPDDDWSRNDYILARASLDQVKELQGQALALGMDPRGWDQERSGLYDQYLQVSNVFHGDPAQAQLKMKEIGARSQALARAAGQSIAARQTEKHLWELGLPLAAGVLGLAILGVVLYSETRQKGEKKR